MLVRTSLGSGKGCGGGLGACRRLLCSLCRCRHLLHQGLCCLQVARYRVHGPACRFSEHAIPKEG